MAAYMDVESGPWPNSFLDDGGDDGGPKENSLTDQDVVNSECPFKYLVSAEDDSNNALWTSPLQLIIALGNSPFSKAVMDKPQINKVDKYFWQLGLSTRFIYFHWINHGIGLPYFSLNKSHYFGIMSAMTFGQKTFTPTPPDKGSFPLDHEGVCKNQMVKFMRCLKESNNENSKCRLEAKNYLGCRMDKGLMAKEEWNKLGFEDFTPEISIGTLPGT